MLSCTSGCLIEHLSQYYETVNSTFQNLFGRNVDFCYQQGILGNDKQWQFLPLNRKQIQNHIFVSWIKCDFL